MRGVGYGGFDWEFVNFVAFSEVEGRKVHHAGERRMPFRSY
jgi:hypothetical protein